MSQRLSSLVLSGRGRPPINGPASLDAADELLSRGPQTRAELLAVMDLHQGYAVKLLKRAVDAGLLEIVARDEQGRPTYARAEA